MRIIAFFGALFLLSACAPSIPVLQPQIGPETKTVALISALPLEMNYDAVGVTVLGNTHEAVSVRDWRLNDLVLEKAGQLLQGRFTVEAPHLNFIPAQGISASEWVASISNQGSETSRPDLYIIVEAEYNRRGRTVLYKNERRSWRTLSSEALQCDTYRATFIGCMASVHSYRWQDIKSNRNSKRLAERCSIQRASRF